MFHSGQIVWVMGKSEPVQVEIELVKRNVIKVTDKSRGDDGFVNLYFTTNQIFLNRMDCLFFYQSAVYL